MSSEAAFLRAIEKNPSDASLRGVLADWLEERGDARGELLRILSLLTQTIEVPGRVQLEERLRSLVASGVQPVGPFYTNSIGMKFALIWPGTFLMGSPEDEDGRAECEAQHKVTLTTPFWLAVHPVTTKLWRPGRSGGDDHPVTNVDWHDCLRYCHFLGERDRRHNYRLPTEAEWEYACRAGTTSAFHTGGTISTEQTNVYGPGTVESTTPVGSFGPNAWGLYDMHGNWSEWCYDWYGEYEGEVADPWGPRSGEGHVVRGGSFEIGAKCARSAHRFWVVPVQSYSWLGLRPVMTMA